MLGRFFHELGAALLSGGVLDAVEHAAEDHVRGGHEAACDAGVSVIIGYGGFQVEVYSGAS